MVHQLSRRAVLLGTAALTGSLITRPVLGEQVGDTYPYLLGDEIVTIRTHRNGNGPTYVCPHDNENTAVDVSMQVVAKGGGKVIHLIHSGERNITFKHAGKKYVFDPNRMFTNAGIKASLRSLGSKNYSEEAHHMIREFADVFMVHFNAPPSNLIVAVHNNTPGAYSVLSYQDGGQYEKEAEKVHVNPKADADDFFFVTSERLFGSLSALGFNVVLQAGGATDDGSLSVYAAAKRIPYVNVEAEAGHTSVQRKMLEALL